MAAGAKKKGASKTRAKAASKRAPAKKKAAAKKKTVAKRAPARRKKASVARITKTTGSDTTEKISDAMRELSDSAEPVTVDSGSEEEISIDRSSFESPSSSGSRSRTISAAEEPTSHAPQRRLRTKDVTSFLRQLIMLLDAGTPMLKSLKSLETRGESKNVRAMVAGITGHVEAGNPLWQAFERESFAPVDVNLIKASEASGTLTTVLSRIVKYREQRELLKKRVQAGLIYPVVLVAACFAVIVVIAKFVIPQFVMMFVKFGIEIEGYTAVLVGIFDFVGAYWWVIVLAVVGFTLLYTFVLVRNPVWRMATDRLKLRIPIVGSIMRKNAIVEFCRTFALMLRSGLSMLVTLDLSRNAIGNRAYVDAIQDMRDSVERGEGLEHPLRSSERKGLFPGIVVDMLVTGEETGTVDVVADHVADTYEEEVKIAVAALGEAMMPAAVVTIGAVVVAIALALFTPMIQMIDQIASGGI